MGASCQMRNVFVLNSSLWFSCAECTLSVCFWRAFAFCESLMYYLVLLWSRGCVALCCNKLRFSSDSPTKLEWLEGKSNFPSLNKCQMRVDLWNWSEGRMSFKILGGTVLFVQTGTCPLTLHAWKKSALSRNLSPKKNPVILPQTPWSMGSE